MTQKPFDSAKLLLDRAREHREEFRRRSEAWQNSNPYTTIIEFDVDRGQYVRKARFPKGLPGFLFPVAADAFNNLRHTLDHAICASAAAKDPATDLTGIGFAFGRTEAAFERHLATTRKKVAHQIVTTMRALKPYKGGNDRLSGLSALTNANKHRNLIALSYHVKRLNIHYTSIFINDPWSRIIWDSSKNELTIAVSPFEDELKYDLDLEFFYMPRGQ